MDAGDQWTGFDGLHKAAPMLQALCQLLCVLCDHLVARSWSRFSKWMHSAT